MNYTVGDYVIGYYGPVMHVDTNLFGLAVKSGDVSDIEKQYEDLCASVIKDHAYHHEEINRHFNRMRVHVAMNFAGKDTKPPSLPYVFFGM